MKLDIAKAGGKAIGLCLSICYATFKIELIKNGQ